MVKCVNLLCSKDYFQSDSVSAGRGRRWSTAQLMPNLAQLEPEEETEQEGED